MSDATTDWRELAGAIAADLEIPVPGDEPRTILATLYEAQAKFNNDTDPRNDNSYYQHLDAAGAAAVDQWGERLKRWIAEVHRRCANESGEPAAMQLPPLPAPSTAAPPSEAQAPAKEGWRERIALVVAVAALSLLILALANIISRYPWLAVLVGLPWVLYMRRKR